MLMPEGWGGGGEGLQDDGNEKREEAQGREKGRKMDGSRGGIERGRFEEGSDIDTQSKPKREEENSVLVGSYFLIQALKCCKTKSKQPSYIFEYKILISQAQISSLSWDKV